MLGLGVILLGYLLGSISSAILVCRLMGLPDPRTHGSHNPGTTNVLRIGGKKAAIFTLIGDVVKGVIPVLIAKHLHLSPAIIALTTLAAVLGHLYPIFFRFEGGKGVATAFGAIAALSPIMGFFILVIWLITAFAFRYASFAAIVTAIFAPLCALFFLPFIYTMTIALISILVIVRHRSNMRNLLFGTEKKIKFKKD